MLHIKRPIQSDAIKDDCLSAASLPVQTNSLPVVQARAPVQVNPPYSPTTTVVQFSLPQPTLPPIPSRIQERIAKCEHIDFTLNLLSENLQCRELTYNQCWNTYQCPHQDV